MLVNNQTPGISTPVGTLRRDVYNSPRRQTVRKFCVKVCAQKEIIEKHQGTQD